MSYYYHEWSLISTKIRALVHTSSILCGAFDLKGKDEKQIMVDSIGYGRKNIIKNIQDYTEKFGGSVPENSLKILNDFLQEENNKVDKKFNHDKTSVNEIIKFIVNLSLLENEITYTLKDSQVHILKTVEIAFSHLQRQLIADESVKKVWNEAKKEVRYEKLGGAHLLLHKIWAFKVDATGARTDLVLETQVPIIDSDLYQSVDGLVLTEWKKVDGQNDLESKINSAKEQAKKYAEGPLATIELSNYRYLVMVSEKYLKVDREKIIEDSVIYKVINIAYNPDTPSVRQKAC